MMNMDAYGAEDGRVDLFMASRTLVLKQCI